MRVVIGVIAAIEAEALPEREIGEDGGGVAGGVGGVACDDGGVGGGAGGVGGVACDDGGVGGGAGGVGGVACDDGGGGGGGVAGELGGGDGGARWDDGGIELEGDGAVL